VRIADFAFVVGGGYLVLVGKPLARAIVRQPDLNIFRLRRDTDADRRRWERAHALTFWIGGSVALVYGLWRAFQSSGY